MSLFGLAVDSVDRPVGEPIWIGVYLQNLGCDVSLESLGRAPPLVTLGPIQITPPLSYRAFHYFHSATPLFLTPSVLDPRHIKPLTQGRPCGYHIVRLESPPEPGTIHLRWAVTTPEGHEYCIETEVSVLVPDQHNLGHFIAMLCHFADELLRLHRETRPQDGERPCLSGDYLLRLCRSVRGFATHTAGGRTPTISESAVQQLERGLALDVLFEAAASAPALRRPVTRFLPALARLAGRLSREPDADPGAARALGRLADAADTMMEMLGHGEGGEGGEGDGDGRGAEEEAGEVLGDLEWIERRQAEVEALAMEPSPGPAPSYLASLREGSAAALRDMASMAADQPGPLALVSASPPAPAAPAWLPALPVAGAEIIDVAKQCRARELAAALSAEHPIRSAEFDLVSAVRARLGPPLVATLSALGPPPPAPLAQECLLDAAWMTLGPQIAGRLGWPAVPITPPLQGLEPLEFHHHGGVPSCGCSCGDLAPPPPGVPPATKRQSRYLFPSPPTTTTPTFLYSIHPTPQRAVALAWSNLFCPSTPLADPVAFFTTLSLPDRLRSLESALRFAHHAAGYLTVVAGDGAGFLETLGRCGSAEGFPAALLAGPLPQALLVLRQLHAGSIYAALDEAIDGPGLHKFLEALRADDLLASACAAAAAPHRAALFRDLAMDLVLTRPLLAMCLLDVPPESMPHAAFLRPGPPALHDAGDRGTSTPVIALGPEEAWLADFLMGELFFPSWHRRAPDLLAGRGLPHPPAEQNLELGGPNPDLHQDQGMGLHQGPEPGPEPHPGPDPLQGILRLRPLVAEVLRQDGGMADNRRPGPEEPPWVALLRTGSQPKGLLAVLHKLSLRESLTTHGPAIDPFAFQPRHDLEDTAITQFEWDTRLACALFHAADAMAANQGRLDATLDPLNAIMSNTSNPALQHWTQLSFLLFLHACCREDRHRMRALMRLHALPWVDGWLAALDDDSTASCPRPPGFPPRPFGALWQAFQPFLADLQPAVTRFARVAKKSCAPLCAFATQCEAPWRRWEELAPEVIDCFLAVRPFIRAPECPAVLRAASAEELLDRCHRLQREGAPLPFHLRDHLPTGHEAFIRWYQMGRRGWACAELLRLSLRAGFARQVEEFQRAGAFGCHRTVTTASVDPWRESPDPRCRLTSIGPLVSRGFLSFGGECQVTHRVSSAPREAACTFVAAIPAPWPHSPPYSNTTLS
ncbi:hypothetical protein PAPYR_6668 [Paratrimastix pyriformis]|uniref:Uncharacterized protein n=1 Tax=Paratrimastix pyriformis TaxID=342808 RepID=A0ABQ8UJ62_9EUKA|nr:hypothetical protein PAPYR_6668 [Paratrimastix pyriformis]